MKAIVNRNGGMNFTGVVNSGFEVQRDTDVGLGWNSHGVCPMEMIALGNRRLTHYGAWHELMMD